MQNSFALKRIFCVALKRGARKSPGPLQQLPDELKLAIVAALPDITCVVNLAVTGADFYRIVAGDEARLAYTVTKNNIGGSLMPYAVMNYKLSVGIKLGMNRPHVAGLELIADCINKQADPDDITSFRAAFQYQSIHSTVQHYAYGLAGDALCKAPRPLRRWKLSASEYDRFVKALYMFEIICNGFWPLRALDQTQAWQVTWVRFWRRSAPWVMQQTRRVGELLIKHIEDVLVWDHDRAARRLIDAPRVYNSTIMTSFAFEHGLQVLGNLEKRGKIQATRHAVTSFVTRPESRPLQPCNNRLDMLWLKLSPNNDPNEFELSLDVDHVLFRYPETELGPTTSWYHTLVQSYLEDGVTDFGADVHFSCGRCMGSYMFWDLKRLNNIHKRKLPTITDLQNAAAESTVHPDDLVTSTWGRSFTHCCTCQQ
ncbi:hypothetical protein F5Y15DRAFT_415774 [Xylariaceae sp. FL0016]|nr:hypothetical protein F5Y15DRAFT_415774 [Xylariaceae sp. FL0016]